jgi:hypothetical protein
VAASQLNPGAPVPVCAWWAAVPQAVLPADSRLQAVAEPPALDDLPEGVRAALLLYEACLVRLQAVGHEAAECRRDMKRVYASLPNPGRTLGAVSMRGMAGALAGLQHVWEGTPEALEGAMGPTLAGQEVGSLVVVRGQQRCMQTRLLPLLWYGWYNIR